MNATSINYHPLHDYQHSTYPSTFHPSSFATAHPLYTSSALGATVPSTAYTQFPTQPSVANVPHASSYNTGLPASMSTAGLPLTTTSGLPADLHSTYTSAPPSTYTTGVTDTYTTGTPGTYTTVTPGTYTAGLPASSHNADLHLPTSTYTTTPPSTYTTGVPSTYTAGLPGTYTAGLPGTYTADPLSTVGAINTTLPTTQYSHLPAQSTQPAVTNLPPTSTYTTLPSSVNTSGLPLGTASALASSRPLASAYPNTPTRRTLHGPVLTAYTGPSDLANLRKSIDFHSKNPNAVPTYVSSPLRRAEQSRSGTIVFKPRVANFNSKLKNIEQMDLYVRIKIGRHTGKTSSAHTEGNVSVWPDQIALPRKREEFAELKIKQGDVVAFYDRLGGTNINLNEIAETGKVSRWYKLRNSQEETGEILIESEFYAK